MMEIEHVMFHVVAVSPPAMCSSAVSRSWRVSIILIFSTFSIHWPCRRKNRASKTGRFLARKYRWTWIWQTQWDQENWFVQCKICGLGSEEVLYSLIAILDFSLCGALGLPCLWQMLSYVHELSHKPMICSSPSSPSSVLWLLTQTLATLHMETWNSCIRWRLWRNLTTSPWRAASASCRSETTIIYIYIYTYIHIYICIMQIWNTKLTSTPSAHSSS